MPPGTAISSSRAGRSAAQNPVRAPAGQEDETARRGAEGVALTADGQLAVQHVEAFILAVVDNAGAVRPRTLVSKTLRAPPVEGCDAFRSGPPARPAPAGTA